MVPNGAKQGHRQRLTSLAAIALTSCMQILPTDYDGHRFRSRTEARWAAFFKAASIRYEYESEGYGLPSGWYLPDFFLPDIKTFVEIKGLPPSAKERAKCEELAEATRCNVVIGIGAPHPQNDLILIMPMPCGGRLSYDFNPNRVEVHSSALLSSMRSIRSERFGIHAAA